MEPGGSLQHSQKPTICPYPEPFQSSSSNFLKLRLNIILPFTPTHSKWSLSLRFPHHNPICHMPHSWSNSSWFHHKSCRSSLCCPPLPCYLVPIKLNEVDSSWNVMAHGDAREGKWRRNWRMEWVASTLHTTSENGASSITTADAHTSAASSRLNWRPRRFKWNSPFRRKKKSGFCACAITFQTQSTTLPVWNINQCVNGNLAFLRLMAITKKQVQSTTVLLKM